MAKKAKDDDAKRPKRHMVVIDPDLARTIGIIASALDVSVPDWINNTLRPIADVQVKEALKHMGLGPDAPPQK